MENVVSTVKSTEVSSELKGAFRLLEAMFGAEEGTAEAYFRAKAEEHKETKVEE